MIPTLHASCVVVGEKGVLIRGRPGSGKSALAMALVETATLAGRFARLVADDRVSVVARGGRLIARVPTAIAGLIEQRGTGILRVPFEPACVLRQVIDLADPGDAFDRMPPDVATVAEIERVRLPLRRLAAPLESTILQRLVAELAAS